MTKKRVTWNKGKKQSGMSGKHHSEATKKRMSEVQKGRKLSEEHKKKLSEAALKRKKGSGMTGKEHTKKSKKQMSDAQKGIISPMKGKPHTKATKKKMSKSQKGRISPMKGKKHTEVAKNKMSKSKKGKPSVLKGKKGRKQSELIKRKISSTMQKISYDEWEAFACESKYCPKFTEACRESNREKYGRECFICGKSEKANGQKLSVHHVDMDKAQGCESNWKLVPLCRSCHSSAHNEELIARLGYLIKEE